MSSTCPERDIKTVKSAKLIEGPPHHEPTLRSCIGGEEHCESPHTRTSTPRKRKEFARFPPKANARESNPSVVLQQTEHQLSKSLR